MHSFAFKIFYIINYTYAPCPNNGRNFDWRKIGEVDYYNKVKRVRRATNQIQISTISSDCREYGEIRGSRSYGFDSLSYLEAAPDRSGQVCELGHWGQPATIGVMMGRDAKKWRPFATIANGLVALSVRIMTVRACGRKGGGGLP
jgi:hypothetical protein